MRVTDLGVAFRWRPCDICLSRSSRRVSIDTGLGTRTICRIVDACDRREAARRMQDFRDVQNRTIERVAPGVADARAQARRATLAIVG